MCTPPCACFANMYVCVFVCMCVRMYVRVCLVLPLSGQKKLGMFICANVPMDLPLHPVQENETMEIRWFPIFGEHGISTMLSNSAARKAAKKVRCVALRCVALRIVNAEEEQHCFDRAMTTMF